MSGAMATGEPDSSTYPSAALDAPKPGPQRQRAQRAAMAILAVVGIGVTAGVYLSARQPDAPTAGTQPSPGTLKVGPERSPADAHPPIVANDTSKAAPTAATAAGAGRGEATPTVAGEAPRPPEGPATSSTRKKRGARKRGTKPKARVVSFLRLSSTPPGASVFIGGRRVCAATPCRVRVRASEGSVELVFRMQGHVERRLEVRPVRGQSTGAHAKLVKAIRGW